MTVAEARAELTKAGLRHLLFLIAVCGILAGPLRAPEEQPAFPAPDPGQASHPGGGPCQDPDGQGHACATSCLCFCCPGHAAGMIFTADRVLPDVPRSTALEFQHSRDLQAKDVLCRIFHPPNCPLTLV